MCLVLWEECNGLESSRLGAWALALERSVRPYKTNQTEQNSCWSCLVQYLHTVQAWEWHNHIALVYVIHLLLVRSFSSRVLREPWQVHVWWARLLKVRQENVTWLVRLSHTVLTNRIFETNFCPGELSFQLDYRGSVFLGKPGCKPFACRPFSSTKESHHWYVLLRYVSD